jgi:hypothetical protein
MCGFKIRDIFHLVLKNLVLWARILYKYYRNAVFFIKPIPCYFSKIQS